MHMRRNFFTNAGPGKQDNGNKIFVPLRLMYAMVFVYLVFLGTTVWYSTHQPWIGIKLANVSGRIEVSSINNKGPATGILANDDIIKSIVDEDGDRIRLKNLDLTEDPDELRTFDLYDRFIARQNEIYKILCHKIVIINLADGRIVRIQPELTRPVYDLGLKFWFSQLFSVIVLIISMYVWILRKNALPTYLTLLSGIGLYMASSAASIYISREIALDGIAFHVLSIVNQAGNRIFAFSGLTLMMVYPTRLINSKIIVLLWLAEIIYFINLSNHWLEPPYHAYYMDFLAIAVSSLVLFAYSWIRNRHDALSKTIVKALYFPIVFSVLLVMGTFLIPNIVRDYPSQNITISYYAFIFMYAGMAVGVVRFRLFAIDKWMARIWIWFAAGLALVLLDSLISYIVNRSTGVIFFTAALWIVSIYMAARKFAWDRFINHKHDSIESCTKELVSYFIRRGSHAHDDEYWKKFIADIFSPASMDCISENHGVPSISSDGTWMIIPAFNAETAYKLYLPERGMRLFTDEDMDLITSMHNIARHIRKQYMTYKSGVEDERKRIARDLHDDIGGRLLDIIHLTNDSNIKSYAHETMDSLRDIIYYALNESNNTRLSELVGRLRAITNARLENKGIKLDWKWKNIPDDLFLSSKTALYLSRIIYECVSNAIRHGGHGPVSVHATMPERGTLVLVVRNSVDPGVPGNNSLIHKNHGLSIIESRVTELHGKVYLNKATDSFEITVQMPLEGENEKDIDH